MVAIPDDYTWSSYRHNALGAPDPVIKMRACYRQLGVTDAQRQAAYRNLVKQANNDAGDFRDHLHRQQPMGNDRFRAAIEAQTGRSSIPGKSGRPRKQTAASPAPDAAS